MAQAPGSEAALYAPVRDYLEAQGYAVKSEVHRCDVVAQRGAEPLLVVELKRQLTLDLLLQGIDRQAITDVVYLGVPSSARRRGRVGWRRWRRTLGLLRRLGLGLLVVHDDRIEVVQDPAPYTPRRQLKRATRLLAEFERREGDPNTGGVTRRAVVTSYRQDALRCARLLAKKGPSRLADIRVEAGVERASRILQRDLYGWFVRCERGVYNVAPGGRAALEKFADALPHSDDAADGST